MAKSLTELLIDALPELADNDAAFHPSRIFLRNDLDGVGDYIESWNYEKPLPQGFKIGK